MNHHKTHDDPNTYAWMKHKTLGVLLAYPKAEVEESTYMR